MYSTMLPATVLAGHVVTFLFDLDALEDHTLDPLPGVHGFNAVIDLKRACAWGWLREQLYRLPDSGFNAGAPRAQGRGLLLAAGRRLCEYDTGRAQCRPCSARAAAGAPSSR